MMKQKKSRKSKYAKAKKIVLGILLAYIAVLLIIYGAGVFYFSKHFFLGAQINGADCSGKTVKEWISKQSKKRKHRIFCSL